MSSLFEFDPHRIEGSGLITKGTSGEALGSRNVVYLAADGLWYLADSDAVATMSVIGITRQAILLGNQGEILRKGFIGLSTWTWTVGGTLYASATAGALTQTPPVAGTLQVVGICDPVTNMIWFDPSGMGAGAQGCAILEGAAAYVGFDECKEPYANYFLCDGVADDVQIQAAFAYLTVGRTWKETVIVEGDLNISVVLDIPSYTRLLIRGSLTWTGADGAGSHMIDNDDQVGGNTDIEIIGGLLDGANAAHILIDFVNVDNFLIENVTLHDSRQLGAYIELVGSTRGKILSNLILGNTMGLGCNILDGCTDIIFAQNIGYLTYDSLVSAGSSGVATSLVERISILGNIHYGPAGAGTGHGVDLFGRVADTVVDGNVLEHLDDYGINLSVDAVSEYSPNNVVLSNNIIVDADIGMSIGGFSQAKPSHDIVIEGNKISGCGTGVAATYLQSLTLSDNVIHTMQSHGVRFIDECIDLTLGNNVVHDIGIGGANFGGFSFEGVTTDVITDGNRVYAGDHGLVFAGTPTYHLVTDNDLRGFTTSVIQFWATPTNSVFDNNFGYNPVAASVPAVGASPVTFGPYLYPIYVEVVGNVTGLTVRGQATSITFGVGFEGSYALYPGDTIVITYPVGAPVVTLWPQ